MYKIAAAGAAAAAMPLALLLLAAGMLAPAQAQPGAGGGLGGKPTALARRDIPASYMAWHTGAARKCPGLPWSDRVHANRRLRSPMTSA